MTLEMLIEKMAEELHPKGKIFPIYSPEMTSKIREGRIKLASDVLRVVLQAIKDGEITYVSMTGRTCIKPDFKKFLDGK